MRRNPASAGVGFGTLRKPGPVRIAPAGPYKPASVRVKSAGLRKPTRIWFLAGGLLLLVAVSSGCSPLRQGRVFLDPGSGQPVLTVALCPGERIEAAQLSIPNAPEGHGLLWRVERRDRGTAIEEMEKVELGVVPPGFEEVVPLDRATAEIRPVEFTAELAGGAAATASDRFELASLREPTPEDLARLRDAARDNCNHLPFSLPQPLEMFAPLALLGSIVVGTARTSRGGLRPRVGSESVWRWSFAVATVVVYVLLIPVPSGSRTEPLRFLSLGSVLALVVIAAAALGRRLRRASPPRSGVEALIVGVTCLLVMPVALFLGFFEGGMLECGDGWAFDCSPTWWDRLFLVTPLVIGWIAAVRIGEGGWWLTDPRLDSTASGPTSRPPVKRAIVFGVLLLAGSVSTVLAPPRPKSTPITLAGAADLCDLELVRDLLAGGADPDRPGALVSAAETQLPLQAAARYCDREVIDALIGSGADVNPAGTSPLVIAASAGNESAFDALLDAGAQPDQKASDGYTLLAAAARQGDEHRVRRLLAAGAPADDPVAFNSPLFQAVVGGHAGVTRLLLEAGADPNRRAELNWLDLGVYLFSRDEHEQEVLVNTVGPALGLDPEVLARIRPGDVASGVESVRLVADPTAAVGSFPPLYVAAVRGDVEVVRVLLAGGADPRIGAEPSGHLPAQAAEALGHREIVALLAAAA